MCVCAIIYSMRLMIAPAGSGKTYWLENQSAEIRIDCTNLPHRATLCAVATALLLEYQTRATVDELTAAINTAPPVKIALDNIDRCGNKLQYSLLAISARHDVTATATLAKRVTIITERTAAVLVPAPRVSLSEVARLNAPTLTPSQIKRVALVATTPAHAVRLAVAIANGEQIPTPPTSNNNWIMLMIGIAIIAYIRYTNPQMSPVTIAIITAGGYVLRRLLWRSL